MYIIIQHKFYNSKHRDMGKRRMILAIAGPCLFLFAFGIISGNPDYPSGSGSGQTTTKSVQTPAKTAQTVTKSAQTKTKTTQAGTKSGQVKTKSSKTGIKTSQTKVKSTQKTTKSETVGKGNFPGTIKAGTQIWAVANLNVSTFRNGDTIPEVKNNKDWVAAGESGKPACCYYNNDPANGKKYGKLYNWYAINDPRGLAPAGWTLPGDDDWMKLNNFLGKGGAAGRKMKNITGWNEGDNGTNESGFTGLPGGYRVENGAFRNLGSIGIWWSTTESKSATALDHYLSEGGNLSSSNSPRARGESVRCMRE
jgi:uncharacterized protein (TIGR02145 family)